MGVFDQAARFSTRADPEAVLRRLLPKGESLLFREWLDTRKLPLPGGGDRTADLVAALDAAERAEPWLVVFEFESHPDDDKIDVTLEEVSAFRNRVRHSKGKYRVTAALVYLTGRGLDLLDMTFADGSGTRHAPLVWNVAGDDAASTLEAVAAGEMSWGKLFWVPLMARGDEEGVIRRWHEVVTGIVTDARIQQNIAEVAIIFADLAGRFLAWERVLKEWKMTESMVVNTWIERAQIKSQLEERRSSLLELLRLKFPGKVSEEIAKLVDQQSDLDLLRTWFRAAAQVPTMDDFVKGLRG